MTRRGAVATALSPALLYLLSLCPAAGDRDPAIGETVRTVTGVVRECSVERGLIVVEGDDGRTRNLRLDKARSLAFQGLYTLGLDELKKGMRVEVDSRTGAGNGVPLVTWIEVISPHGGDGNRSVSGDKGERR